MFIKAFIFDGHKRMGEIVCDHISGDRDSVGIRGNQFRDLIVL